ncbi:MAG: 50S ribosomal protein L35 [bacterium]|nr:50S ribosomal protein L35 [bacterium]
MKTRKSIQKRFKLTRSGKILCRAMGQDHFRAKKTGSKKRQLRKWVEVTGPMAKKIKELIK